MDPRIIERAAQIIAHRAVGGLEHDPATSKFHGYCAVCVKPWPCEYAGVPPDPEKEPCAECERNAMDLKEMWDAFGHPHEAQYRAGKLIDACLRCGLDIRHAVHASKVNRDARIAALLPPPDEGKKECGQHDPGTCCCHSGSVCGEACYRGAHHGGCPHDKPAESRGEEKPCDGNGWDACRREESQGHRDTCPENPAPAEKPCGKKGHRGAINHKTGETWCQDCTGKCAKDEVHCTCVPALRLAAQQLQRQLESSALGLGKSRVERIDKLETIMKQLIEDGERLIGAFGTVVTWTNTDRELHDNFDTSLGIARSVLENDRSPCSRARWEEEKKKIETAHDKHTERGPWWDCPPDCEGCTCPFGKPPCSHCTDHSRDECKECAEIFRLHDTPEVGVSAPRPPWATPFLSDPETDAAMASDRQMYGEAYSVIEGGAMRRLLPFSPEWVAARKAFEKKAQEESNG